MFSSVYPIKAPVRRICGLALFLFSFSFFAARCGSGVSASPGSKHEVPIKGLAMMGYSIQIGAFSNLRNAVRATENLQKMGLDAYYFIHKEGLYKVRFGDFPTRSKALIKAEKLRSSRMIDAYYIVKPEDYGLAASRKCGKPCLGKEIVRLARTFVGVPYQYGSASAARGFDCSGFTMTVYRLKGLRLPRSSREQWVAGLPVRRGRLSEGDLVFFDIVGGKGVSHVGIFVGKNRFIHAPSRGKKIQISSLSNPYFKTRYMGARTYF
jgi:hypothetical protein